MLLTLQVSGRSAALVYMSGRQAVSVSAISRAGGLRHLYRRLQSDSGFGIAACDAALTSGVGWTVAALRPAFNRGVGSAHRGEVLSQPPPTGRPLYNNQSGGPEVPVFPDQSFLAGRCYGSCRALYARSAAFCSKSMFGLFTGVWWINDTAEESYVKSTD